MLIKVFTYGPDGFDSLNPPRDGSDFIVGLYRLPRGYSSQIDCAGHQYIECPNRTKVYELEQTARRNAVNVKFSYLAGGKRRTVWLKFDEKATHDMFFSGEDYRCMGNVERKLIMSFEQLREERFDMSKKEGLFTNDLISRKAVHDNIGETELFAYLTDEDIREHNLYVDEYGEFYFTEEQGRIASVMYVLMRRFIAGFPAAEIESNE